MTSYRVGNRVNRFSFLAVFAFACQLILISGCDSGPVKYDVSGKVTYQGEAVSGGLINFMPSKGRPYGGKIDSDGSFNFQLLAGDYKVRIVQPPQLPDGWKEGDSLPENYKASLLPVRYSRFESSQLTLTVSDNSDSHTKNFDLE